MGVCDARGRLDDSLEHAVEGQLGRDRDACLHERSQTFGGLSHRHRAIVAEAVRCWKSPACGKPAPVVGERTDVGSAQQHQAPRRRC